MRGLGFKSLGFKSLGFKSLGFKSLGFRGLGFRAGLENNSAHGLGGPRILVEASGLFMLAWDP